MKTLVTAAMVTAAAAAGPCAPLSDSTAWEPNPNTIDGFREAHIYNDFARGVSTPSGYERVLLNSNATVSSPRYMRYQELESYNTETCAETCDDTRGCDACMFQLSSSSELQVTIILTNIPVNIYYQRNPSIVPDAACPNPKANILTLCALYAEPVDATSATNNGQVSGPEDANGEAFTIAIRGSNGRHNPYYTIILSVQS